MKMPDSIDPILFAPCGMNCLVCFRHCRSKRPCKGCRNGGRDKPGHCRNCKLKDCAQQRGLSYCHECPEFPCKPVKQLDRSYRTRYQAGLIQNSLSVRADGLAAFLQKERDRWRCGACGGVISIHDGLCSECQKANRPAAPPPPRESD